MMENQRDMKADVKDLKKKLLNPIDGVIVNTNKNTEFRFRRISPHGNIDCDGIYKVNNKSFDVNSNYKFVHYSNCQFFHINQNGKIFRFEYQKNFNS